MDFSVYSSRKVVVALVLLMVALATTYFKSDIPNNLLSFMEVLFATFVVGNSVEHVSSAVVNKTTTK